MKIAHTVAWTALAAALLTGLSGIGADLRAQSSGTTEFTVAVLPFSSSDEGKAKDLQKEVIADMDELGSYTLIEQNKVNDAVEDAGLKPGAEISAARALELGRALDAKIVARGTLTKSGDGWTADPVFADVATRNTQDLGAVSDGDVGKLGEKLVEAFNTRNQADKHVIFGRDYMRGENYERAIKNFQQALEFDPNLASAYYYMGEAYLAEDRVDEALAELEKAVEMDPAYISAYHTIGSAYLEKGDTTQARNFFEQLVSKKAQDCDIQVAYGYVMVNQLEETESGLQAFEKAKQLCPDNPNAYQYLAYALPNDQRDQKIDNFKRYLELSEGKATDPEALEFLFGLYFAEERYQEAQQTIDQALAADPSNPDLQLYAGIVNSKLENHRQAIEHYDKALEINPQMERAYLYRALAHKELGNTSAYARDLEKAGRGQASEIIGGQFLRDGALHIKNGRIGAGLEALNRASQLGADGCAIAYYRGDAYYQMGKASQGEEKSLSSNQQSLDRFRTAINHLNNARCGQYGQYANGLINNANEYIDRGEKIIQKKERSGR